MAAPGRPLRADAARNRALILDAARSAFADGGLDVGVEEIARRAAVPPGIGPLPPAPPRRPWPAGAAGGGGGNSPPRAGGGKGTLYRRFPTKEALVRAIFDEILADFTRVAEDAGGLPDPWDAF